jgi:aspartate aminotransferase-like enzyme
LSEVYLASGATGKSLGSFAGASLIFADREALSALDRRGVPSYFDLVAALSSEGPCYTFPSPTLAALETALRIYDTPEKAQATYAAYHALGMRVRHELQLLGLTPLAAEECAAPVVTSFSPPGEECSDIFVKRCRSWGYAIGGESTYLSRRRLVQIATMGAVKWEMFADLFAHLERWLARRPVPSGSLVG